LRVTIAEDGAPFDHVLQQGVEIFLGGIAASTRSRV